MKRAPSKERQRWAGMAEELAGLGYWRMDVSDKTLTWSPNMFRVFGFEPGHEPPLEAAMDRVHPDDRAASNGRLDGFLAGTPGETSSRIVWPDGTIRHLEGRGACERNGAGEVVAIFGVVMDVTDRRAAEAGVAARETQLKLISEHTRDVVFQFDLQHRILYASPAVRRFGYEPDELVGTPAADLVHPDDRAKVRDLVVELAGGVADPHRDRTCRVRAKSGSYVWMDGQPTIVRDPQGRPVSVVTLLRDIDGYRAATDALADSEARYRLMADNVTDIVSRTAIDGTLLYLSPAVRRVTGHAPEDLLGGGLMPLVHPDDRELALAYYRAAILGDRADRGPLVYRARCKSGDWIWLECNPTVVRDAAGEAVEFVDVTRDVTARHSLEEALRAARDAAETAAAVKADFMANMSHEIRTPLTAVLGYASLVAARTDLDPVAREHADRISAAGRALLGLVNDVLDFSKLEAGRVELNPRPVDPAVLGREALDLFDLQAETKGLELSFEPAPNLPPLVALDAQAVRQVLLNLLGNAVKFSDGGTVRLALDYDHRAGVLRGAVHDTGPGLSPDQAAKLFQRFSQVDGSATRRHGGTGLGLAICRGLIEAMGGDIGVETNPGEGATFGFAIPAPLAAAPGAGLSDDDDCAIYGVRLLVIDDNPINRELVRAILQPLGVEITEAVEGTSGLQLAAEQPFDLILLDIRMPGLNGHEVLARIRAVAGPNQDIPILAFSADVDPRSQSGFSAGFDGQVAKPLNPGALIRAVAHWSDYAATPEVTYATGR